MSQRTRIATLALLALAGWLGSPAPAAAGDGFGMLNKDYAFLQRIRPPKIFLNGTRIAVRATAQQAEHKEAADRLRSLLESEVLSGDSRLAADTGRPDTLIEAALVQNGGSERWETRTVLKQRKTGRVDDKGKPIYEQYEDTVKFKIVTYNFGVAYKVQDARTKANLDADTITRRYEKDFQEGTGAPDLPSLESKMMGQAVEVIKLRITPSREEVGVLIPRGSLKELANLATAGLWNQYLEAMETQPPRPKPDDEAYRQYAQGLAYEALGYAAGSADDTLRYLQQASIYYGQALQMNPGEKYFSLPYERKLFNASALLKGSDEKMIGSSTYPAPLERVKGALVDYQRLKEFNSGLAGTAEGGKSADLSQPGAARPAPAEDVLTNTGVIEMVKAGLPEEIILTAIDAAQGPSFDVSAKGLIELGKAKVPKTIIQRIQARAGGA